MTAPGWTGQSPETGVDDTDGTELTDGEGETVTFTLGGHNYEIDLSLKNADKLRGEFQDYIAAGRTMTGSRVQSKSTAKTSTSDAKNARAWAKENNIEVPERGRIADVRERCEKVVSWPRARA